MLDKLLAKALLIKGSFEELFNQLGWEHFDQDLELSLDDNSDPVILNSIAQKRGFAVYSLHSELDHESHGSDYRRLIGREVEKLHHEHIIIFNEGDGKQYWQLPTFEPGKQIKHKTLRYDMPHDATLLVQRLEYIHFGLEEEEEISLPEVNERARTAFMDKVTNQFYKEFRIKRTSFVKSIKGISRSDDNHLYASLMLNRMMFVYFIQKQGLLDNNHSYLQHKLMQVRKNSGAGHFIDFYRGFLMRLFHDGFGKPIPERSKDFSSLFGNVPYLNGSLFEIHLLEKKYPNIRISDEAFAELFNFFDSYQWNLDDRPIQVRRNNEINPDVLGYIFEKYILKQKEKGAYYTNEDVTGYIGRNSINPYIFDQIRIACPEAILKGGYIWKQIKHSPDRYLFAHLKYGISNKIDLVNEFDQANTQQTEIIFVSTSEKREINLDDYADRDYALPYETWRQMFARRERHKQLHEMLLRDEIDTIDGLVTHNLNIERLLLDMIYNSNNPNILISIWKTIRNITILDPTCGSGAFLFAALNILEPVYTACFDSLKAMAREIKKKRISLSTEDAAYIEEQLRYVSTHSNERYFFLKSIAVNNLFGVDIEDEAAEICKLRLYLKLISAIESSDDIEPLPDIDFNIRVGNTLVGYTSLDQLNRISDFGNTDAITEIIALAKTAEAEFKEFQEMQTEPDVTHDDIARKKAQLLEHLSALRYSLDELLAKETMQDHDMFDCWQYRNHPFHWLVEYYGILNNFNGFDVVIGNPPYVKKTNVQYSIHNIQTTKCPDLYAMIVERSLSICSNHGRIGMIVPLNLTFGRHYSSLRNLLYSDTSSAWFSTYNIRPSMLFKGASTRNTICLAKKDTEDKNSQMFTTRLHRWYDEERPSLFNLISYIKFDFEVFDGFIPKCGNASVIDLFEKLLKLVNSHSSSDLYLPPPPHGDELSISSTAYNWLTGCLIQPPAYDSTGKEIKQTKYFKIRFKDMSHRDASFIMTNGRLMFLWWIMMGDSFDVTQTVICSSPISKLLDASASKLSLKEPLYNRMSEHPLLVKYKGKRIGNYDLLRCRDITDVADKEFLMNLGVKDCWDDILLEESYVLKTEYPK